MKYFCKRKSLFKFLFRPWGLNAMCLSSYCGHIRLVEYLINKNVNINETDAPNSTDSYFNNLPNNSEHKLKMREMHSRVAQDMGMFFYPIDIIIKKDFIDLLKLFLQYRNQLDIEVEEPYTKRTPLHIAAEKCSIEVRFLVDFFFERMFSSIV